MLELRVIAAVELNLKACKNRGNLYLAFRESNLKAVAGEML
jgi:hypothetical protein